MLDCAGLNGRCYLSVIVGQAVPLNRDTIRRANLFDVPFHNDIAELLVQFNGIANTVGLFAGDQRAARATKWVQNQAVS